MQINLPAIPGISFDLNWFLGDIEDVDGIKRYKGEYFMSKLFDVLNQVVATQNVLYIRLHQFHFYVKGPHFFTLHEKWEEMYNEVTADMDEVAERLIQLGGEPVATLQESLDQSVIKENQADKNLSDREMVEATLEDLKAYRDLAIEARKNAEEEEDEVTVDIFVDLQSRIDLTIWFFEAWLS